jgi:hypothetical protein
MTAQETWSPPRAASKIIKVVETFSAVHGMDRFPLDVATVALEAGNIFGWSDPISEVHAASIKRFEGALFPNDDRSKWLLLYNNSIVSPGRIRFTQAHELGHYVLHRTIRGRFQCGDTDVLNWPGDEANIESQADAFASYLLMPIDDFRNQTRGTVDLNMLAQCADRYGVSLTAAVLKWIQFTEEKATLVVSKSGFVDWAWSSDSAFKAGAFIRSKSEVVELPIGSVAAEGSVRAEREGREVQANIWFKHADKGLALREMKLQMDQFDCILTLLVMPRIATFWPPFHRAAGG